MSDQNKKPAYWSLATRDELKGSPPTSSEFWVQKLSEWGLASRKIYGTFDRIAKTAGSNHPKVNYVDSFSRESATSFAFLCMGDDVRIKIKIISANKSVLGEITSLFRTEGEWTTLRSLQVDTLGHAYAAGQSDHFKVLSADGQSGYFDVLAYLVSPSRREADQSF
ncbi:hypothetical protein [Rhodopirellula bahusiensis]|uniref:hypothetical protein n=1 Tax=Rhodopirellula bahusiensis TaxID=2014065 RepID=UPI00326307F4